MIRRWWHRLLGRPGAVPPAPTHVELNADVAAFIEGMLRARDAVQARWLLEMPLLWEGDQA